MLNDNIYKSDAISHNFLLILNSVVAQGIGLLRKTNIDRAKKSLYLQ